MHAIQQLKVIPILLVRLLISLFRRLTVYVVKLQLGGVPLNEQQFLNQRNMKRKCSVSLVLIACYYLT